jgi:hypothetical protein
VTPQWNPDGRRWRAMPKELIAPLRARAKGSRMFRRLWFWLPVVCLGLTIVVFGV